MLNDRFSILNFNANGVKVFEVDSNNLLEANSEINFYKPLKDDKFEELKTSIKEHGVLHPLVVWETEDGKYTILSGHNRKRACDILAEETGEEKYKKIACKIFKKDELDDMKAQEIIIDTNWVQRELSVLEKVTSIAKKYEFEKSKPSFSYKDSVNNLCRQYKLKERQLMYYKKLGNLKRELLDMIDSKKISIKSGARLAGFSEDLQEILYECFKEYLTNSSIMKLNENMNLEQIENVLKNEKMDEFVKIEVKIPKKLKKEFNLMLQDFLDKHKINDVESKRNEH